MSNSNAAAIKRRANTSQSKPAQMPSPVPPPTNGGYVIAPPSVPTTALTLPQAISLIDRRLILLETFMKKTEEGGDGEQPNEDGGVIMDSKEFTEFIGEINNRFQILADELASVKDIVLKLQSFTMEVNKSLLEDKNIITPKQDNIQMIDL